MPSEHVQNTTLYDAISPCSTERRRWHGGQTRQWTCAKAGKACSKRASALQCRVMAMAIACWRVLPASKAHEAWRRGVKTSNSFTCGVAHAANCSTLAHHGTTNELRKTKLRLRNADVTTERRACMTTGGVSGTVVANGCSHVQQSVCNGRTGCDCH
jgi:hypothetical protein